MRYQDLIVPVPDYESMKDVLDEDDGYIKKTMRTNTNKIIALSGNIYFSGLHKYFDGRFINIVKLKKCYRSDLNYQKPIKLFVNVSKRWKYPLLKKYELKDNKIKQKFEKIRGRLTYGYAHKLKGKYVFLNYYDAVKYFKLIGKGKIEKAKEIYKTRRIDNPQKEAVSMVFFIKLINSNNYNKFDEVLNALDNKKVKIEKTRTKFKVKKEVFSSLVKIVKTIDNSMGETLNETMVGEDDDYVTIDLEKLLIALRNLHVREIAKISDTLKYLYETDDEEDEIDEETNSASDFIQQELHKILFNSKSHSIYDINFEKLQESFRKVNKEPKFGNKAKFYAIIKAFNKKLEKIEDIDLVLNKIKHNYLFDIVYNDGGREYSFLTYINKELREFILEILGYRTEIDIKKSAIQLLVNKEKKLLNSNVLEEAFEKSDELINELIEFEKDISMGKRKKTKKIKKAVKGYFLSSLNGGTKIPQLLKELEEFEIVQEILDLGKRIYNKGRELAAYLYNNKEIFFDKSLISKLNYKNIIFYYYIQLEEKEINKMINVLKSHFGEIEIVRVHDAIYTKLPRKCVKNIEFNVKTSSTSIHSKLYKKMIKLNVDINEKMIKFNPALVKKLEPYQLF